MTDLTPPITDAEGEEACRRLNAVLGGSGWRWPHYRSHWAIKMIVQAMREPAWVPEVADKIASIPRFLDNEGEKHVEHPDWVMERVEELAKQNPHLDWARLAATALMTPPPKPPVDDATLCWREFMANRSGKNTAEEYLAGDLDHQLTEATRQLFEHALNWAKNREKRDD